MADEKLTSPQFLLFESESEAERDAEVVAAKPPTGAFSNFIVYVDESGDHGMQTLDVNYPMFVLAFCVFEHVRLSPAQACFSRRADEHH
jgi:hypothetical protein